ncbi:MAG: hypothetical protein AUF64_00300 [Chloroflexi bacterium 13_1_20CM_54_36]|nr:MAG: hypothetical protein AUF64_00300 [Chloroflexi bacterium 13_1_20CM_54_36]OLE51862.1 MAG: hypothetical protein AUG51_20800 [Acidobacteria bacterium 13_1_20CM_3_53_8]
MTTTEEVYTYTLIEVYDMREIDEISGERIPLDKGEGSICNRCGREHAKVYVVSRDQDAKQFCVGSTCCKKLFGWEPEKEELRRLAKEAKIAAENRAFQRLEALAKPIADAVNALVLPRIIVVGERGGRFPETIYGAEGSGVQVHSRQGLTDERRRCFLQAWMREQVVGSLEVLYPRTSQMLCEDINWRKREKISREAYKMLELW